MNWIRSLFKKKNVDRVPSSTSQLDQKIVRLSVDNPITKPEDDALGRLKPASSFATQILSLDASEGVAVGVLGAWGAGKTSFVNLAQGLLEKSGVTVLEFNPWMFSGADQLVQSFFIELSAQLKIQPGMAEVGERIEEYGESFSGLGWLPLVGPWIERGRVVTDILAKSLQRKKEGVKASQSRVRDALKKLNNPIVVVLDDIDRLSTPEIRDVFKLVRLTANFPNIIYLLAFDRYRVEQALGEQGVPGRDYLEKILQIGVDLPAVPDHVLNSQIFKAIDGALEDVEKPGYFDSELWPDVFMEVIQPLIRNMRDVRRYAASIHGTVRDLEGQVALVDILALEAIRVFLPDVFHRLRLTVDGLTATANGFGAREEPPHLKEQVEILVEAGGDQRECVRNLIRQLFPGGERHLGGMHYGGDWKSRWLRERRVAHEDVLRYYLERVIGEQLQAFSDAEGAWEIITDKTAFSRYLDSLPIERVQDVISSLEVYEDKFDAEHVVPGAIVLLNILPKLPDRQLGMFDPDIGLIVGRVVYRLVRALKEPEAIEEAVKEILPEVKPLSSKQKIVTIVGYREGAGHKLVSEAAAERFEAEVRTEVRDASPEDLARDTDLLRTLLLTKREAAPDEPELKVPDSPQVTYALLKSARSEVRSQSMGSRAVRRKPRLAWDVLTEVYNGEDKLREQIEVLKASPPEDVGDLLELADKYLSGWRPKEFDDD
ncbi:KAP family P-loop NTPase fold protein [Halomonas caseinilytica]|uniref:Predicted P-loop ATPase, KAP-like n=1 Tax=Halomonas caseinilytica TaxID=438744 RepID=A0A1M6V684_9GAMM|nr:P-loop NTPase fold protein [Halomonas caseinilytica]SHK76977.1 Predicted P-loop ATPase, KAP-like [Halomonas caseinilytica]